MMTTTTSPHLKSSTKKVLRMRSTDKNRDKDVGKFFVHTVQLLPKSSCRVLETMKILSVNSENETTLAFKCQVSAATATSTAVVVASYIALVLHACTLTPY